MEESDHELSDEGESDADMWAGLIPGPDERTEQCKIGGKILKLPELFLEKKHIFSSVLSMETWKTALTDEQRQRLEGLLPDFPGAEHEKQETLKMLFNGDNFKFGNPLQDLRKKLKEGYLHPEIARYRKQTRQFRYRDYKMRQQRHLSDLLKRLLLSRQELFEQALSLAPGDPLKFQYPQQSNKKTSPMEQIIKKKTVRILKEVREECGVPDTSSDEDEESASPVQRSKRQLIKSLGPIPSPEPTIPSVVATYASKPMPLPQSTPAVNGDVGGHDHLNGEVQGHSSAGNQQMKRPRPISPVEVTEDSYKLMLRLHKRKRLQEPDLPELDTSSVTLQDILSRCQANKKNLKGAGEAALLPPNMATVKKRLKMKAKGEKKRKIKNKEPPSVAMDDDVMMQRLPSPGLDASSSLHAPDALPDNPLKTVYGPAANFCCLLRDILLEFPEGKTSVSRLEERLREWLEQNDEISNPWMALLPNWEDQVTPALKYLAGADQGSQQLENYTPLVECINISTGSIQERVQQQQWRWVGPPGLDSDADLAHLFRLWLQAKEEPSPPASSAVDVISEISSIAPGSPPPPKAKTNFIVRPTSSTEKALFREQERSRFATPHKAFTFMMHGYDSVVGPVKGVYDKDSSSNKAREHNLLVSDRPPFVTILTLVRDAAARLPNGEGTRGDICELLKDSQFLAPGVTDTQINAVVSGALDRLHSEKDPCVKYDVTRKLWIYLHRNRTEDEFERIHQAQAATAKVKKTVAKPKAAKASKDSAAPSTTAAPVPSTVEAATSLHPANFTLSTLPTLTNTAAADTNSTSLLTKAGKSATLLRTPSLGVGVSGVPGLTPTIAQLRAAQAAMAKSAGSSGANKPQTVRQLTQGQKKSALLTSSTSASVTGSPLLTVTSLGLSMTSSSSQSSSASTTLSVSGVSSTSASIAASPSLAAQLLYSPGAPLSSPSAVLTQQGKINKSVILGATPSTQVPAPSPTTTSTSSLSLSVPVSSSTTFSLVTTLNTASTNAPSLTANTSALPSLRPPTISMLQGQQHLIKQQRQQQQLLKQQQQQQKASHQSILRQNAALLAAANAGQVQTAVTSVAIPAKLLDSAAVSHATAAKPQTLTMTARPALGQNIGNVTLTKSQVAGVPSLRPSSNSSSSTGAKQTSLILTQENVAGLATVTCAAGGAGKLVALTSVAGQPAGEATVMAQIMQQPGAARVPTQAIRLQGGGLVQPILSGKPVQMAGKPLGQGKTGLVQLAGKGGQPLGLIRTPQGPLSTISLIPQAVASPPSSGKTATVVAVGSSSSAVLSAPSPLTTTASPALNTIITTSASGRQQQQQQQLAALAMAQSNKQGVSAGQAKIIGHTPSGLLVTQLAPGNIALRAGSGQAKVLSSGQAASLVPTQFILQHAPGAVSSAQGAPAPIIVSNNAAGGKAPQSLQVVRTVLSQPGNLKPGQATILISQPTLAQGVVPSTQALQSGGKASGRGSPKGKGQPVYARIITPPPGMKLTGAGAPANVNMIQTVAGKPGNVNMLQTVSGKTTNMNMIQAVGGKTGNVNMIQTVGGKLVSLAMVSSADSNQASAQSMDSQAGSSDR